MTGPHDRWDELAAAYALDALEPAEEAELLAHLDSCQICRHALRDHELVAAQLAALAEDNGLTPPSWSSMRSGIVGPASRSRRPVILAAAAAAALIVAGVVTAVTVGRGTSAREAAINQCRAQADCHIVDLSRGSTSRAVVIVRNDSARLWPTDMSTPGNRRVYALWQLPRDGKPTLLAQPVSSAKASSAPLALPYDETAAFALSIEPSGPEAVAPTDVIAVGTATT